MGKPKISDIPYWIMYPKATWKDIYLDGKKSKYKVGDCGVVLSFAKKKPKILKGHITKNGYMIYCLKMNGRDYWSYGHRLVATAFIPIPEDLKEFNYNELEVNHKKGDSAGKLNNDVSNLEWVTSSGNKYHAYDNDLKKSCEDHYHAIYTNDRIRKVCSLLQENKLSRMKISQITGVDDGTIGQILAKTQWRQISKDFDFSKRKKKHALYDPEIIKKALTLLAEKDENTSFAEIGRKVGMSRTSVHYLYRKYFNK